MTRSGWLADYNGHGIHREAIVKADQSNSFIRHWRAYLLQRETAPRPTLPRLHKA